MGARPVRLTADWQSAIDLIVEFEPEHRLLRHAHLWLELKEVAGGQSGRCEQTGALRPAQEGA